jgi:hypothetical protein
MTIPAVYSNATPRVRHFNHSAITPSAGDQPGRRTPFPR